MLLIIILLIIKLNSFVYSIQVTIFIVLIAHIFNKRKHKEYKNIKMNLNYIFDYINSIYGKSKCHYNLGSIRDQLLRYFIFKRQIFLLSISKWRAHICLTSCISIREKWYQKIKFF